MSFELEKKDEEFEENKKKIKESENLILKFLNKKEEIKFFLREYKSLENQKFDYYYLFPYKWIKIWDSYICENE